jgi:hypothetical protein
MLNTNIPPRCDFFIRTNSLGLQRRAKQALSTKSLVDEPVDKSGTSVYSWGISPQKLWTRWGMSNQFFDWKSH